MAPLSQDDERFVREHYPDEGMQFFESLHPAIPPPYTYIDAEIQWKDREGKVWNITDMSDDHIENSMRMLLRQAESILIREATGTFKDAPDDVFNEFLYDSDGPAWKYIARHYPPYRAMAQVRRQRRLESMQPVTFSQLQRLFPDNNYECHDDETVKELVLFMMTYPGPMADEFVEQGIRRILGMPLNKLPDVKEEEPESMDIPF